MTTFTLQDLYTPTTEGKSNIMETTTQTVDTMSTNQTIQGATGAQYTPMDTSPQAQQNQQAIEQLLNNLTYTIQAIIKLSVEKYKQPVSEGLSEAVGTVLEQAEWFNKMVNDSMVDAVEGHDFSSDIETAVGSEVEQYFNYNFNLEDHCDVYDLMRDAVDDKLEDMVQEKLNELMQGKNITISFN